MFLRPHPPRALSCLDETMRIGIFDIRLARKAAAETKRGDDGSRPVKFVPDGYNSWRVVWAD